MSGFSRTFRGTGALALVPFSLRLRWLAEQRKQRQRIYSCAVEADSPMEMRPGHSTGGPEFAKHCVGCHRISLVNVDGAQVRKQ